MGFEDEETEYNFMKADSRIFNLWLNTTTILDKPRYKLLLFF